MDKGNLVNEFLKFDKMITPSLIKIIFYIGVVVSVLSGLGVMISGFNAYNGGFMVFMGLIMIILSPIFVRVYCELLIILFKIHEHLSEIRKNYNQL